ncbi:MAG TPA: hypothetical protein VNR87_15490 [Flavisolibacter sp.]|nr:hypothetical protein [Flavisolibacter sp.]
MKNLLAFLVLLSHMNFSMFIPQLDEQDEQDEAGCQLDDVNSLYEYIDQVVLGHKDDTPEDEDNDSPAVYHIVKINGYSFSQNIVVIKRPELMLRNKAPYPLFVTQKMPSVFFEIQSPPPEA